MAQGWKRIVPASFRHAYRDARDFLHSALQFLREWDTSSLRGFRDSLRLFVLILRLKPHTFLDAPSLRQLYLLARKVDQEGIAGDIVECGVYQGGSAALLGYALRQSPLPRHLWLFDSFQGMPAPTQADGAEAPPLSGQVVGNERNVRKLLRKVGTPPDRVHIHAGWFQETLASAPVNRVAMLHVDADWYESIRLCLERFYDRLEPGGIVILDDYDCWPGCKKALEDFVQQRGLRISLQVGHNAPAYFRKEG